CRAALASAAAARARGRHGARARHVARTGAPAMSPGMGPVRMRSRLPQLLGISNPDRAAAFELWKTLPRARPYLQPYRRTLAAVGGLTVAAAALGLAEPWPLAVILNEILTHGEPSGIVRTIFGAHPETWVVLVSMVSARFSLIVLGNGVTVLAHYLGAR